MSNELATNRPTEWVSKDEAIKHLEAAGMLPRGAARPIILEEWCAAGGDVLEAKARVVTFADGKNMRDLIIPKEVWKDIRQGHGFFDARGDQLSGVAQGMIGLKKLLAYGIQFRKDQLDELAPARAVDHGAASRATLGPAPNQGGSPGKVQVWHDFYYVAMEMLYNGELDGIGTQGELLSALADRINHSLSDESLLPQVRKIWRGILGKI